MYIADIQQVGSQWQFDTEVSLENFLWSNLDTFLGLKPLKRQYYINGQYCDILAVNNSQQLTVVELKNSEDRYLVQQLTRYYDCLVSEKPFSEVIDYSQPIVLWAIAPHFHRDNYSDRKYCNLVIDFLKFEVVDSTSAENLELRIQNLDTLDSYNIPLIKPSSETSVSISAPPNTLRRILAKSSTEAQSKILEIREKILRFDSRMQELTETGVVRYGRGKNKICAEFRFDEKRNQPTLYLWLPNVQSTHHSYDPDQGVWHKKLIKARMRLWSNWQVVEAIGHVPKVRCTMVSPQELSDFRSENQILSPDSSIKVKPLNKVLKQKGYAQKHHYKSGVAMTYEEYIKTINRSDLSNHLDTFVDLALDTWLSKNESRKPTAQPSLPTTQI